MLLERNEVTFYFFQLQLSDILITAGSLMTFLGADIVYSPYGRTMYLCRAATVFSVHVKRP